MIYPCSLPDPNDCANKEIVNNMDIVIFTEEVSFDPSNQDDPIDYIASSDTVFHIDIFQSNTIRATLQQNEIYDEKYDFLGESLKASYLTYSNKESSSELRDSN